MNAVWQHQISIFSTVTQPFKPILEAVSLSDTNGNRRIKINCYWYHYWTCCLLKSEGLWSHIIFRTLSLTRHWYFSRLSQIQRCAPVQLYEKPQRCIIVMKQPERKSNTYKWGMLCFVRPPFDKCSPSSFHYKCRLPSIWSYRLFHVHLALINTALATVHEFTT